MCSERVIGMRMPPRAKPYHFAALISERGVSALCFARPRPIDLSKALWTIDARAVTCKRCLAKLKESAHA